MCCNDSCATNIVSCVNLLNHDDWRFVTHPHWIASNITIHNGVANYQNMRLLIFVNNRKYLRQGHILSLQYLFKCLPAASLQISRGAIQELSTRVMSLPGIINHCATFGANHFYRSYHFLGPFVFEFSAQNQVSDIDLIEKSLKRPCVKDNDIID